jgi:hypothetical protein
VGETPLEALYDWISTIESIWMEFSVTPDSGLTDDAIVLRDKLRAYVTADVKP